MQARTPQPLNTAGWTDRVSIVNDSISYASSQVPGATMCCGCILPDQAHNGLVAVHVCGPSSNLIGLIHGAPRAQLLMDGCTHNGVQALVILRCCSVWRWRRSTSTCQRRCPPQATCGGAPAWRPRTPATAPATAAAAAPAPAAPAAPQLSKVRQHPCAVVFSGSYRTCGAIQSLPTPPRTTSACQPCCCNSKHHVTMSWHA